MALPVETGDGLAASESFVTLEEARAFASSRGVELTAVDADAEVLLRKVHDYLLSLEHLFRGQRKNAVQALPFPRSGMTVHNELFSEDAIPLPVKNAVCQLAIDVHNGAELLPNYTGNAVVKEKVGPILVEYATGSSNSPLSTFSAAMAFLAPVIKTSNTRTLRV